MRHFILHFSGDVVVRREMATALGARGASSAVPALLEAARDADAGVRGDAMKALRVVADVKACPRLVAL
jgi:HEAT repeat protein